MADLRVFLYFLGLLAVFEEAVAVPSYEANNGRKTYSGYKLLRTEPLNRESLANALLSLDGMHGIHFWTYPLVNQTTDILASPRQLKYVENVFGQLGVGHNVVFHDAEELINTQLADVRATPSAMSWSNYQRYDTIMNFARSLAKRDPSISYQAIGKTSEGREIGMVRIGNGNKPGIWIDGGMHAREWISPATTTFIMNKLASGQNKELTDMFDWYFVPMINADGYEYTHTRDRFWRKTRSSTSGGCRGVDPNRNWGFHWAESGSSRDPCSETYHGPRAFSEPETAAVSRAILGLRDKLKMYVSFHSYSQMWLVPWGYARGVKPSDYNELMSLARIGKQALERTYGTQYRLGTAPDLLYAAAGGSDDWAKGAAGIKYSYTLELRDTGRYGFALPANQIVPTGEETFNGIAALAKALHKKMRGLPYDGDYDLDYPVPDNDNSTVIYSDY